ncbi:MAG: Ppx/GppA family phosphatase, partial [Mesorhizobium sp.]
MEDHDTGAGASAVGVSGASPTESARFSRHAGAHARHAGQRHADQRHADNQGENQKGKTRKRRKRRRGRKVFARDENGII